MDGTYLVVHPMGTDPHAANALRKKNIENLMPDVFARVDIIPLWNPKTNGYPMARQWGYMGRRQMVKCNTWCRHGH